MLKCKPVFVAGGVILPLLEMGNDVKKNKIKTVTKSPSIASHLLPLTFDFISVPFV